MADQPMASPPVQAHSQTQTEAVRPEQPHLRLIGDPSRQRNRPRVTWSDETVDNEDLGRKKSKICCIYHPPEEFGQSSEEEWSPSSESESESSESDSDSDASLRPRHRHHEHAGHSHNTYHHHHRSRPNAYERQPRKGRTNPPRASSS